MSDSHRQTQGNPPGSAGASQRAQSVARDFFKKYPHVKTNIKFSLSGGSTFGRDAPRYTIPSSRKDTAPEIPLPGPGEYNVSNINEYRKILPVFPKSRSVNSNRSPTANVEFCNQRLFPESKQAYIGVKTQGEFYDVIESPGPSYVMPLPDTKLSHTILNRPAERKTEMDPMGPGVYNVKYVIKREPAFNFMGPKNRQDWMIANKDQPGPGQYNPRETARREPKWTIGRKSRPKHNDIPPPPKDLIAVDQCIIRLEVLSNPAAARLYIMTHHELRNVVHELLEAVFEAKPEEPLKFIEGFFNQTNNANNINFDMVEDMNSKKEEENKKEEDTKEEANKAQQEEKAPEASPV